MSGCNKSNHDTLVALGEESYMRSLDDIYPKAYRDQWPSIVSGASTHLNEGFFPPNLNGEYIIKGKLEGGNEVMHLQNGQDDPNIIYQSPTIQNLYTYVRIKDQKNGTASIYIRQYDNNSYNPDNPASYEEPVVDTVYIFGDGATGEFAMCCEATVSMGVGEQYYAFIFSGKRCSKVIDGEVVEGIENIKRWHLVKGRTSNLMVYINNDGQRLYRDKSNFAEKVEKNWGFEEE